MHDMSKSSTGKLDRYDLLAARSLFRSLFQEEWGQRYPTWQEAVSKGSLEWSFTGPSKLTGIVPLTGYLACSFFLVIW